MQKKLFHSDSSSTPVQTKENQLKINQRNYQSYRFRRVDSKKGDLRFILDHTHGKG